MRALAWVALVALVAGCAGRSPAILVQNEGTGSAVGEILLYHDPEMTNDTSTLTGRWEFDVPEGAWRDLGRMPREPQEYHYALVRLLDGREGWGRVHNAPHFADLTVVVRDRGVEVQPQSVT